MFAARFEKLAWGECKYTLYITTDDGVFDLFDGDIYVDECDYLDDLGDPDALCPEPDPAVTEQHILANFPTTSLYDAAFIQELIKTQGIDSVRELYQYRYAYYILPFTTPEERKNLAPLRPPFTSTKEQYLYTISLLHDLLLKTPVTELWNMMFNAEADYSQIIRYQHSIHKMITDLKNFAIDLLNTADHFEIFESAEDSSYAFEDDDTVNMFDRYVLLISMRQVQPIVYFIHEQRFRYSIISPFAYDLLVLTRYPDVLDNPSRFAMFLDNVMPHLFYEFTRQAMREAGEVKCQQRDGRPCTNRYLESILYTIGGYAGLWMTCSETGNGSNSLTLNHPVNKHFIHRLLQSMPYQDVLETIEFIEHDGWMTSYCTNLDVVDELAELNWTFEEVRSELPKIGYRYNLQEVLKTTTTFSIPEDVIPSPSGFTLIPWAMAHW